MIISKEVGKVLEQIVPGYIKYMSNHRAYTGIDYYISFILLHEKIDEINKYMGNYFQTCTRFQYCYYYNYNNTALTNELALVIEIYPKNEHLSQKEYKIIKDYVKNILGFNECKICPVNNIIEPEFRIVIRDDKLTQLYNKVKHKLQGITHSFRSNLSFKDYNDLLGMIFNIKYTM